MSGDVMDALRRARPDLDPRPDPERRRRDLGRAFAGPPPAAARARRNGWRVAWATGAAAATVATAVVVATALSGDPAPPRPAPPVGTPTARATDSLPAKSARRVLLYAASQAAAAPEGTGRWWVVKSTRESLQVVGPPGNRYVVGIRYRDDRWTARGDSGEAYTVSRYLGATPDGSDAAWIRDGRPTSWKVPHGGGTFVIEAAPGRLQVEPAGSGDAVFALGGRNVSMGELRDLPSDPQALRAILQPDAAAGPPGEALWRAAADLLLMPVTPAVRGAAYRLLATLPDLARLPGTPASPGVAVVRFRETTSAGTYDHVLQIRLDTAMPTLETLSLVEETPEMEGIPAGVPFSQGEITSIGWTDAKPPRAG